MFPFRYIYNKKVFGDVLYRKLAYFDHKDIDLKKAQNLHFPKGASPRFLSNTSYWFIFLFRMTYKHCLVAFYIENQPVLNIKIPIKRGNKICIFKKWLVLGFSHKFGISSVFHFMYIFKRKSVCVTFYIEN